MIEIPDKVQREADQIALHVVVEARGAVGATSTEVLCRAYIRAFGHVLKDLRGPETASAELYALADQIATGGRP